MYYRCTIFPFLLGCLSKPFGSDIIIKVFTNKKPHLMELVQWWKGKNKWIFLRTTFFRYHHNYVYPSDMQGLWQLKAIDENWMQNTDHIRVSDRDHQNHINFESKGLITPKRYNSSIFSLIFVIIRWMVIKYRRLCEECHQIIGNSRSRVFCMKEYFIVWSN